MHTNVCLDIHNETYRPTEQESKKKPDKDIEARRTRRYRNTAGRRVTLQREGEKTRGKEGSRRLERKGPKRDPWCERQRRKQQIRGLTETECWKENSVRAINMHAKS